MSFLSDKRDAWKVNNRAPMLGGKQINEFQACCVRAFVYGKYCKSDVFSGTFCACRLACVQTIVRSLGAANLIIIAQNLWKFGFVNLQRMQFEKLSVSLDNSSLSRAYRGSMIQANCKCHFWNAYISCAKVRFSHVWTPFWKCYFKTKILKSRPARRKVASAANGVKFRSQNHVVRWIGLSWGTRGRIYR